MGWSGVQIADAPVHADSIFDRGARRTFRLGCGASREPGLRTGRKARGDSPARIFERRPMPWVRSGSVQVRKHSPERVVPYDVVVKQGGGGMQADEEVAHGPGGFMDFLDQLRQVFALADKRRQLQSEKGDRSGLAMPHILVGGIPTRITASHGSGIEPCSWRGDAPIDA